MRLPGVLAALTATLMALMLAGCPNPNDIGVQTYGTVAVTVVDSSTGKPVAGALVSAGSTITCMTGADGMCQKGPLQVPAGSWTIQAAAAGLRGSADVVVTANQQSSVTIQLQ